MSGLRWHARCICVAVTLGLSGLWGGGAPAVADPTRARAHFELAKRFFEVNEYRRAMEEFKVAYVEEPDPAFLYNIAECHRRLGEVPDALVFYRRFLLLAPAGAPARPSVEKRIAELQARIRDAQASAAPLLTPGSPAGASAGSSTAAVRTAPEPAPSSAAGAAAVDLTAPAVSAAAEPGSDSGASLAAAPASGARPFYRRPWFFAVVGGALVAGTIGVWAASTGKEATVPATPLGNQSAFR